MSWLIRVLSLHGEMLTAFLGRFPMGLSLEIVLLHGHACRVDLGGVRL